MSEQKREAIISAGTAEFAFKAYADASTDVIAKNCGISKGLLFHYFGTKKELYLACLTHALERLTQPTSEPAGESFYDVIFSVMDDKLRLCARCPDETALANMASRESALEVAGEKDEIVNAYLAKTRGASAVTIARAITRLELKPECGQRALEGLMLYVSAVISKYLKEYQSTPNAFFNNADSIKNEIKSYIDLILYGIVVEGNK